MKDETKEQLINELEKLRQRISESERSETECKRAEKALKQRTYDLNERLKELNCLYGIDKISKIQGITIEEVLKRAVRLIPSSWQYPEITGSRITFENREYKSRNFKETEWMQKTDIILNNKKVGLLEVCYLEEKSESNEGPFLKEERNLINSVADHLGQLTMIKKAQEALRESEERYRNVVENANDAIYIIMPDGFKYVNPAFEALTGYASKEVYKKEFNFWNIIHRSDIKLIKEREKSRKREREIPNRYEFRIRAKDGKTKIVEASTVVIGREGEAKVMGILRDLTEHKRDEEELRESEEKYRSLFDNMLEGFAYCKIIVDKNNEPVDFEYIEINDAFEKLTGLKKEQVAGKRVTEAIPGIKKANPELFKVYGKVALTGKATNFDVYFVPLKIWLSISVYCPKKGYFVAVFDNITKRKRNEESLRESELKLQKQKSALEQKNIALREVISQVEVEKRRIKDDIETNANILIFPILEKLKIEKVNLKYINLLRHHIKGITSSFGNKVTKRSFKLSPREIEICSIIKEGFRSKDISYLLNISCATVEEHRKNIRHKLGISNKGINLTCFLRES